MSLNTHALEKVFYQTQLGWGCGNIYLTAKASMKRWDSHPYN